MSSGNTKTVIVIVKTRTKTKHGADVSRVVTMVSWKTKRKAKSESAIQEEGPLKPSSLEGPRSHEGLPVRADPSHRPYGRAKANPAHIDKFLTS